MILRPRRATQSASVDTDGTWAISYGDMVTLLLLFFVLFFSLEKVTDNEKQSAIQEALLAAFSPLAINQPILEEQQVISKLVPQSETIKIGSKILVMFPGISFFNFANVDVTAEGKAALKDFVKKYMPYAGHHQLGIRAYTDNKPVVTKRRYKDNLELSALRAVSAMRVLQKAGIPLNYMKLGGYGELNVTMKEIEQYRATADISREGMPLARKIVLVIEAIKKDQL